MPKNIDQTTVNYFKLLASLYVCEGNESLPLSVINYKMRSAILSQFNLSVVETYTLICKHIEHKTPYIKELILRDLLLKCNRERLK